MSRCGSHASGWRTVNTKILLRGRTCFQSGKCDSHTSQSPAPHSTDTECSHSTALSITVTECGGTPQHTVCLQHTVGPRSGSPVVEVTAVMQTWSGRARYASKARRMRCSEDILEQARFVVKSARARRRNLDSRLIALLLTTGVAASHLNLCRRVVLAGDLLSWKGWFFFVCFIGGFNVNLVAAGQHELAHGNIFPTSRALNNLVAIATDCLLLLPLSLSLRRRHELEHAQRGSSPPRPSWLELALWPLVRLVQPFRVQGGTTLDVWDSFNILALCWTIVLLAISTGPEVVATSWASYLFGQSVLHPTGALLTARGFSHRSTLVNYLVLFAGFVEEHWLSPRILSLHFEKLRRRRRPRRSCNG